MFPKFTNIYSSYRYSDKETDTLTSYCMSGIFTDCEGLTNLQFEGFSRAVLAYSRELSFSEL